MSTESAPRSAAPFPPQSSYLPRVHEFGAGTGQAYDMTQCSDSIRDGDVLVIPSEQVAGVLVRAWPVAVTASHGELHPLTGTAEVFQGGAYQVSIHVAQTYARAMNWPLRDDPEQAERRRTLRTHRFASTADARAAVERGAVPEGDVIIVEADRVVGFVDRGQPVAVTVDEGAFDWGLFGPARWHSGAWSVSLATARRSAVELGFPLFEEFAESEA